MIAHARAAADRCTPGRRSRSCRLGVKPRSYGTAAAAAGSPQGRDIGRLDGKRCGSRAKTFASMAVTRFLFDGLGLSLDADRAEQKGRKMAVPFMNGRLGITGRLYLTRLLGPPAGRRPPPPPVRR